MTTDLETTVLRVIRELGQPYGVEVWRATNEAVGRAVSIAALYNALEVLEDQRLIRSWEGEGTPERGGRPKRYYIARPQRGGYWP